MSSSILTLDARLRATVQQAVASGLSECSFRELQIRFERF